LLCLFTGVFYFIFFGLGKVCIIACPYGRLQALLDNKSINVAYDFVRGEKRKVALKFNKQENRAILEKAIV
jgi:polyferredoxin